MSSRAGLRVVASFEAAKGAIVLVAGMGLFELMHRDVQAAAEHLVHNLHLNPASHYPRIFIDASVWLNDSRLRMLAVGAMVYALVRFVEAYGLWRERRWAEWFGAISGGIYLPLEIYNIIERISWARVTLFVFNCLVVAYLAAALTKKHPGPTSAAPTAPTAPA